MYLRSNICVYIYICVRIVEIVSLKIDKIFDIWLQYNWIVFWIYVPREFIRKGSIFYYYIRTQEFWK